MKAMKYMKYLFAIAVAMFATATISNAAGTAAFVGVGSSALFQELGQAAVLAPSIGATCSWTQSLTASAVAPLNGALDNRPAPAVAEGGNIWVAWQPGTGTCAAPAGAFNVYAYLQTDSVVGDKCFFANPSCNLEIAAPGAAPANLLVGITDNTPAGLPAAVQALILHLPFTAAGTDIRPEDAKFATFRMFTTCGSQITRAPLYQDPSLGAPAGSQFQYVTGLGYQTSTPNVGAQVKSFYSAKLFNVLNFNISGTDPFTGRAVQAFAVTNVGAQPVVVAVNPSNANGFGDPLVTNVPRGVLARYLDGTLGRTDDAVPQNSGAPVAPAAATALIREPLSGTYNTMEYSIPNTIESQTSQDDNNCTGSTFNLNPLHAPGIFAGSFRNRVIGTGEMTAEIQAVKDSLGYFFWSTGNAAKFTEFNGRYLTVDGVDPIQEEYTAGVVPTAGNSLLGNVTFSGIKNGSYAIWSVLRLVSAPGNPGVAALQAAAQSRISPTQPDFVLLSQLQVLHSHFAIPSIGVGAAPYATISNGNTADICGNGVALAEFGGDVGGLVITKQTNQDYCTDYPAAPAAGVHNGGKSGLINKIQ